MTNPIRYIILSHGDPLLQQVFLLRHEVLRLPLGLSLFQEDTSKDGEDLVFVAVQLQAQLMACLMAKPIAQGKYKFRQMAVAPQYQGKGIGKALVLFAEEKLLSIGTKNIELHARQYAVPFYEKLGYKTHGSLFTEVGIPHLLMEKFL